MKFPLMTKSPLASHDTLAWVFKEGFFASSEHRLGTDRALHLNALCTHISGAQKLLALSIAK